VSKRLGRNDVLRGFSLDIGPGQIVLLLGPNGAGKTTALDLALGLRRPDRGTVTVLGVDAARRPGSAVLGSAPQDVAFPPTVRVNELLRFVTSHSMRPHDVGELLDVCGLAHLATRQSGGLSGGEKRRLALALAMCGRPQILVLDEPTTGLDAESREAMWQTLSMFRSRASAVVVTTHDLHDLQHRADRVVVMDRGAVVLDDSPEAIRRTFGGISISFSCRDWSPASWPADGLGRATVDGTDVHLSIAATESDRAVRELVRRGIDFGDLRISELDLQASLSRRAVLTNGHTS